MICPDCNGDGKLIGMFPVYADHVPQKDRKPFIEMVCPRCKGDKTVPDEQRQWIERGRELRQARVDAKIGLRAFCELNDVNPVDRSKIERGEVDPDTFMPRKWSESRVLSPATAGG